MLIGRKARRDLCLRAFRDLIVAHPHEKISRNKKILVDELRCQLSSHLQNRFQAIPRRHVQQVEGLIWIRPDDTLLGNLFENC